MKATELLEKQHREVDGLFEQLDRTQSSSEKSALMEQIAATLVAHDAIEREIFYPACEAEMNDEHVLGESLVEHGVVEFCLFRADEKRATEELDSYAKVLKDIVQHHVKEEEKELLPKASRELGDQRLEELGAEMEARFADAMDEDFRAPLRDNLRQVLMGKTRTEPERARGKMAATKTARTKRRRYGTTASKKVKAAMHERKRGTLRSGRSGKKVTSRKQAIAIGLSQARRSGGKVPKRRTSRTRRAS
jgi:hemerythrin-like domain-containing protein